MRHQSSFSEILDKRHARIQIFPVWGKLDHTVGGGGNLKAALS